MDVEKIARSMARGSIEQLKIARSMARGSIEQLHSTLQKQAFECTTTAQSISVYPLAKKGDDLQSIDNLFIYLFVCLFVCLDAWMLGICLHSGDCRPL